MTNCPALTGLVLGEGKLEIIDFGDDRYEIEQEQQYLLAPPRVLGWSTQRKTWCQFAIDGIQAANKASGTLFEKNLELDQNMKDMIKALVTFHSDKKATGGARNPDLIEGKGRGLVMLLHGQYC